MSLSSLVGCTSAEYLPASFEAAAWVEVPIHMSICNGQVEANCATEKVVCKQIFDGLPKGKGR